MNNVKEMQNMIDMMNASMDWYKMNDNGRNKILSLFDTDEERKKFVQCMASARLMWDTEYRKAVQDVMGKALYNELKKK